MSNKKSTEEVSNSIKQLDMWAEALGMSKDDLKQCKLEAVKEIAEDEAAAKSGGCKCSGGCKSALTEPALPFLSMLTALLGVGMPHPAPQINLHLHLSK